MKTFVISAIILWAVSVCIAQNPRTFNVVFETKSAYLTDQVKNQIDSIFDIIEKDETVEINVLNKEELKKRPESYKMEFSKKRATIVSNYLLKRNIFEGNVQIAVDPLNTNPYTATSNESYRNYANPQGIAKVILHKPEGYFPEFTRTDTTFRSPGCCKNTYTINAHQKEVVYAMNCILILPPDCFTTISGQENPCEEIQLEFCEFLDIAGIVNAGLTTYSDGKMLSTAGMVYLMAWCGKNQLRLKPGKEIDIIIPTESGFNKKMQLFSGVERNGIVNWKEDKNGELGNYLYSEYAYELADPYLETEFEGDAYLAKIARLGWINVDVFEDITPPTELLVEVTGITSDVAVRMIFPKEKSVLPGYYYNPDKLVKFSGIPKGKDVVLLAYRKDGKTVHAASLEIKLGETDKETLTLKPMTENEFIDLLLSYEQ